MAKSAAEIYKEMQEKLKGGSGPVNPPEAAQTAPADSFERKAEAPKAEEPVQTTVAPETKAAASGKPERVLTDGGRVSWQKTALALEAYVATLDAPQPTPGPASQGQVTLKDYSDEVVVADLTRRGVKGCIELDGKLVWL